MNRVPVLALFLAIAACGADSPPAESVSSSAAPLFRGSGGEVRLRCGSETLRARLRQGQVLAQTGGGDNAVLVPVDDPRARSGPAYSDGRLTLYRVPESQSWALANGASGAAPCTREPAP